MFGFSALLLRMNYINRWGLMRNSRYETLSEHSLVVANLAHILACIARSEFGADVEPDRVACCAMYHDISEIVTGDLPTPVKYKNERIRREYKTVEHEAEIEITDMLPDSIKATVRESVTGAKLNEREKRIIKSADKLSALIKCIEEENNGNTEFKSAKKSTETALEENMLPEVKFFIKNFLPAYELTLDELLRK